MREFLKEHRSLVVLLLIFIFVYVFFHLFFFVLLGNVRVDTLIGFGVIGLFLSVHRYGAKYIHAFFIEHTISIFYFYSSLLSLTWNVRYFLRAISKNYASFLKMKLQVLFMIIEPVKMLYSSTVKSLMELYFINDLYSIMIKKVEFMRNREVMVFEYSVIIDNNNEIELFRTYTLIFFVNG